VGYLTETRSGLTLTQSVDGVLTVSCMCYTCPQTSPGGTLELGTGYQTFRGSMTTTSKHWVTAVEDCGFKLPGVALPLRV